MADHVFVNYWSCLVSCKTDELFLGKCLRSEHCLSLIVRSKRSFCWWICCWNVWPLGKKDTIGTFGHWCTNSYCCSGVQNACAGESHPNLLKMERYREGDERVEWNWLSFLLNQRVLKLLIAYCVRLIIGAFWEAAFERLTLNGKNGLVWTSQHS